MNDYRINNCHLVKECERESAPYRNPLGGNSNTIACGSIPHVVITTTYYITLQVPQGVRAGVCTLLLDTQHGAYSLQFNFVKLITFDFWGWGLAVWPQGVRAGMRAVPEPLGRGLAPPLPRPRSSGRKSGALVACLLPNSVPHYHILYVHPNLIK